MARAFWLLNAQLATLITLLLTKGAWDGFLGGGSVEFLFNMKLLHFHILFTSYFCPYIIIKLTILILFYFIFLKNTKIKKKEKCLRVVDFGSRPMLPGSEVQFVVPTMLT